MREQVTKRLDQLNAGKQVDKSDTALEEVVAELKEEGLYVTSLKKRKSKKTKVAEEELEAPVEKPKKKKKQSTHDD